MSGDQTTEVEAEVVGPAEDDDELTPVADGKAERWTKKVRRLRLYQSGKRR